MFKRKEFVSSTSVLIFCLHDDVDHLSFSPPFFAADVKSAYLAIAETVCRHCKSVSQVFSSCYLSMDLRFLGSFDLESGVVSLRVKKPDGFISNLTDIFALDYIKDYVNHYKFEVQNV